MHLRNNSLAGSFKRKSCKNLESDEVSDGQTAQQRMRNEEVEFSNLLQEEFNRR